MASDAALTFSLRVAGPAPERPRLELALALDAGLTTLAGPSGAGKTSCLLALAGLVRCESGHIVLRGRTLYDGRARIVLAPEARRVAVVFQSLALFPHLTASENVAFGVRAQKRDQRREVARHWLRRMQILHVADRRPATLSGGEAQRVALARALASAPELLLLDEPFSALDPALRRELAEEVRTLVEELQIPALLVSHDPEFTREGERTVWLRDGRQHAR